MGEKRNDYLDVSDEEDDLVSQPDDQEEGRAARIRNPSAKRRKLNGTESEDSQAEEAETQGNHEERNDVIEPTSDTARTQPVNPPHSKHKAAPGLKLSDAHQRKKKKTGVIYLSRIPPFMKPTALRHLLTPYGTLLRIFLTPEPSPAYTKRVRSGGNKKRSFVDGWVEFASKQKAKICAETLNGNIIGGKKGGWYHDDIWNIKYLKGFKWDDLMEQVQDEERIRQGRLRAEILQEAKERRVFLAAVEQDKKEKTREMKRRRRLDVADEPVEPGRVEDERLRWTENRVKQVHKNIATEPLDQVKRVVSQIF